MPRMEKVAKSYLRNASFLKRITTIFSSSKLQDGKVWSPRIFYKVFLCASKCFCNSFFSLCLFLQDSRFHSRIFFPMELVFSTCSYMDASTFLFCVIFLSSRRAIFYLKLYLKRLKKKPDRLLKLYWYKTHSRGYFSLFHVRFLWFFPPFSLHEFRQNHPRFRCLVETTCLSRSLLVYIIISSCLSNQLFLFVWLFILVYLISYSCLSDYLFLFI